MRIAILTFHRAYNCGAMLQAWALQTFLESLGHTVEFPDCNHTGEEPLFVKPQLRRKGLAGKLRDLGDFFVSEILCFWNRFSIRLVKKLRFRAFMERNIKHAGSSVDDFVNRYDLIIVGSDQVWNPQVAEKEWFPHYAGVGIDNAVPMIGYAIGCGDKPLDEATLAFLKEHARRFSALSFREEYLVGALQLPDTPVVCDPTLLLGRAEYEKLEKPERLVRGEYLFAYCVSGDKRLLKTAQELAKRLRVKAVIVDVYRRSWLKSGPGNDFWGLTPDRMLALIRDAKYVVAVSFHGCVFSLLYHKPFISLYLDGKYYGRHYELLSKCRLEYRRVEVKSDMAEMEKIMLTPYCADMEALKQGSAQWLKTALAQTGSRFTEGE